MAHIIQETSCISKPSGGQYCPEGRLHSSPVNFYQFTRGLPAKEPRLPAATPKPQQLHKLAVPQPDLFRRQVRPVQAGIRKQLRLQPVAALSSCSKWTKHGAGRRGWGDRSSWAPSGPGSQAATFFFYSHIAQHGSHQPLGLNRGKRDRKALEMYPPV